MWREEQLELEANETCRFSEPPTDGGEYYHHTSAALSPVRNPLVVVGCGVGNDKIASTTKRTPVIYAIKITY